MAVIIGLTGGIGSGKTTLVNYMESLGIPVFIADEEAKKAMQSPHVLEEVKTSFGTAIFENGHLNRQQLASIVFSNPDKLKEDYDQKEISIKFEDGLKEGQTFCWTRTNTHWMVYLQRYEEKAYFRAQIRRCDYQLFDKYWIYLRSPQSPSPIPHAPAPLGLLLPTF
mgnify:CR=1 FL=1